MLSPTSKKRNLHHLITNICHALPRGVLSIEEITIKGNEVIVRYKTERARDVRDMSLMNYSRAVTVDSYDALRLYDGKVIEHQDTIYQIKTA
jgi:hypothetical protein